MGRERLLEPPNPNRTVPAAGLGIYIHVPVGVKTGSHEWSTWIVFGRMYNMPERVPYLVHTFTRCAVGIAESFSIVNYTYYYSTAA